MADTTRLMIIVSCLMIVTGKPTEDNNIRKRYALKDIIGSVEGDLFKSALSVGHLVHERPRRELTTLPSVVLQKTSVEPTKTPNEVHTKVIVDRVVVFKGPISSLLPQIPVFSLLKSTDTKGSGEAEEESTTVESTTIEDEEVETTAKSVVTTTVASTTIPTTTTTSTTTTTTKAPIVELKEAEEEIQEKIAEVAADPIIFSSRV